MIHLVERRISRCLNAIKSQPLTFFFFNDTATTEIYTLSLHDALPIYNICSASVGDKEATAAGSRASVLAAVADPPEASPNRGGTENTNSNRIAVMRFVAFRSEEHTSELQSQSNLVCRLLLEKTKHVPL